MRAAKRRARAITAAGWKRLTSQEGRLGRPKEILDSIQASESLAVRDFAPGEAIEATALVELDSDGTLNMYFIGPRNWGLELEFQGKEIIVITPQSPRAKT